MLPGDNVFVLKFDLDPAEFGKLLARHKFKETSDKHKIAEGIREYFQSDGRSLAPGLDISLPKQTLVTMYHFEQNEPGLAHYENIFTNRMHSVAIITGDNVSRDENIPAATQPSAFDD